MTNLIGFGLIAIGIVLISLTNLNVFLVFIGVGVLLFASLPVEDVFCDYVIANSNESLVRKRHYINFLPISIVAYIFTLGQKSLVIPWKDEYFRAPIGSQYDYYFLSEIDPEKEKSFIKLSRKEYIALRKEQRMIYSTETLDKAFMEQAYAVQTIGFKRKKRRLILAVVFALITALMAFDPDPMVWILILIYEALFVPMVLLWIPNYKDAKILQKAYDRSMKTDN